LDSYLRFYFQPNQQPPLSSPQNSDINPQEILEQRYAWSEITRGQFDSMI
jgi:hypothetical protein